MYRLDRLAGWLAGWLTEWIGWLSPPPNKSSRMLTVHSLNYTRPFYFLFLGPFFQQQQQKKCVNFWLFFDSPAWFAYVHNFFSIIIIIIVVVEAQAFQQKKKLSKLANINDQSMKEKFFKLSGYIQKLIEKIVHVILSLSLSLSCYQTSISCRKIQLVAYSSSSSSLNFVFFVNKR